MCLAGYHHHLCHQQRFTKEEYSKYCETSMAVTHAGHACLICGTVIRNKRHVKRHFFNKHVDYGGVFVCPACSKCFKDKRNFLAHINRQEPLLRGIDPEKCIVADQ